MKKTLLSLCVLLAACLLFLPVASPAEEPIISESTLPGYIVPKGTTRQDATETLAAQGIVLENDYAFTDESKTVFASGGLEGSLCIVFRGGNATGYSFTITDSDQTAYAQLRTWLDTYIAPSAKRFEQGGWFGQYFPFQTDMEGISFYYFGLGEDDMLLLLSTQPTEDGSKTMLQMTSIAWDDRKTWKSFYEDKAQMPVMNFQPLMQTPDEAGSSAGESRVDQIKDGMVEEGQSVLHNLGN